MVIEHIAESNDQMTKSHDLWMHTNATIDTSNIIMGNISKQLQEILERMGLTTAATLGAVSVGAAAGQNVIINADFPNVSSSAEIQNALNNLMNMASQRVLREAR